MTRSRFFPPRALGRLLVLLFALSLPTLSAADEPSEEELEELERQLREELGEDLGLPESSSPLPPSAPPALTGPSPAARATLLPEISLVGTFSANWFSDEPTLRLPAHEPSHRGLQLQELELAFLSNIDPYARAEIFLSIGLEGIEIEEAYVTTLALPLNLQLRAGAMYAPFGRFNQMHYLEQTPFVDLPLPNRRFFGGEQLRGVGAEGSVLLPLPFFLELEAAALTAGNEVSFGVPAEEIDTLSDLLAVGRISSSFDVGERLTFLFGASIASGPNASGGFGGLDRERTHIFGGDLTIHLRDAASRAYTTLQAEYMHRRASLPEGRTVQGGAYVWLVRRFDARWEAAVRADILGLPGGKAYGDIEHTHHPVVGTFHSDHGHDLELIDFLEPAKQKRLSASLSYYPSEFQRIRLQFNQDFGLETPHAPARAVQELFLQYQFAIGAHGAHRF